MKPYRLSKTQQARLEREAKVVANADYYTVMVWRVGKYGEDMSIKTLQKAVELGHELVQRPENTQKRPAMIYACNIRHLNNVLAGTVGIDGVYKEANG